MGTIHSTPLTDEALQGKEVGFKFDSNSTGATIQVAAASARRGEAQSTAENWLGTEVVQGLLAALDPDSSLHDILNLVAMQSMAWLGATDVIVGRLEPTTQTLVVQAAHGPQTGDGAAGLLAPGLQALVHALAAQKPILFTNNHDAESGSGTGGDASLVVLAVPSYGKNKQLFGGVLLFYAHPPQLSVAEVELAALLGSQIALAFENAQRKAKTEAATITSERNRIARDLHDSVTQSLYTISLIAETLPAIWHSHRAEALQSIESLQSLAQGALAEMRALLLELRTGEQADHNLGEQLRQLADRIINQSKLQVSATVVGDRPLPKDVQIALYRIAQEALNNVDKHARATRAFIQLDFRPDGAVMLRVSDNGCGIDRNYVHTHQLGLGIMRERAREIGAVLTIESQPGQGTQIVALWGGA